jgi:hypothetical protein
VLLGSSQSRRFIHRPLFARLSFERVRASFGTSPLVHQLLRLSHSRRGGFIARSCGSNGDRGGPSPLPCVGPRRSRMRRRCDAGRGTGVSQASCRPDGSGRGRVLGPTTWRV